jgi:S1-C subfamily serine protease
MAKTVLTQLSKGGKVRRGQLGVSIQPLTSEIAAGLGLKEVSGVLVSGVTPGSAAERAGIKPGDVIAAINGQRTNDSNDLRNRIASTPPATEITLAVVRDGKEIQVKATLGELSADAERNQPLGSGVGGGAAQLGLNARPLTPEDAAQLGLPRSAGGLVIESVDPAGPAAEQGIKPGDVIVEANRQPVRSVNDLQSAVQKSGAKPTLLLINRGGATIFVAVKPQ